MRHLRATLFAALILAGGIVHAQAPSELPQETTDAADVQTEVASEQSNTVGHKELLEELGTLGESLNELLQDEESWSNPLVLAPILIGLLSAAAGLGLAFYTERSTRSLQQKERMESHLLDSLKWFEGGTQKRSIGISVVEANWATYKLLRPTWLAVLVNQAVYLLAETKETRSQHEIENCKRIRRLLSREKPQLSEGQKRAIGTALTEREADRGGGVKLPEDELTEWKTIAK